MNQDIIDLNISKVDFLDKELKDINKNKLYDDNRSSSRYSSQQKWLDLSQYYVNLAKTEIDHDKIKDYYKKAERCLDNSKRKFPFNPSIYSDLIPPGYDTGSSYGTYGGSIYSPPEGHTYGGTSRGAKVNKNANPYHFSMDEASEEDRLSGYIEADLPVFIHGKSGCGKSARIKEMDPDCITLYLGSARPETLVGKSIVKDNELVDVPPAWYDKLCEKCESEPDKIHILFLDECTNALPSIQGYAFNLVLDKEVNGKWKLPPNCRVVAAGNEDKESTSANKLSEPMFRRFNHVYIETTVKSWLLWASKHNIHPAIYAFVAFKGDGEQQVLRSECDGLNPCVDPRKWEMASTLLKKTGRPTLLNGIIGPALTGEFIEFCKRAVITLDDVLNDRYDANMPVIRADEALATLIGLSSVDEANVKKVREFVKKYMIPEQYQNFVKMWTLGDKKRIDILQELDMLEELNNDNDKIEVHYKDGRAA